VPVAFIVGTKNNGTEAVPSRDTKKQPNTCVASIAHNWKHSKDHPQAQ